MSKISLNISGKLATSTVVMVIMLLVVAIYSVGILNRSVEVSEEITNTIQPSIDALRLMRTQLERSESLVNAWVNEPDDEKQAELTALHEGGFRTIRDNADDLVFEWNDSTQRSDIMVLFERYDYALSLQSQIMNSLQTFEDYMDKMGDVIPVYEEMALLVGELQDELSAIEALKEAEILGAQIEMIDGFATLKNLIIWLIVVVVVLGIALYLVTDRIVAKPIMSLTRLIAKMSVGEMPRERNVVTRRDEIGKISTSINDLVDGLTKVSDFARAIGDANFETKFTPLSEEDQLGKSLLNMRTNLMKAQVEEKQRGWANEGLAKFNEMLRMHNEYGADFYPRLISSIVEFMGCRMGGIYLLQNDNTAEPYLELKGSYAFTLESTEHSRVEKSEGLVGQCWASQERIYLDLIPDGYSIESGLGAASPSSLLLVPLKDNDKVLGVVELGSFNKLEDYRLVFMDLLATTIASSILAIQHGTQTSALLDESRAMTARLQQQEEEMQENAEKLQMTTEEMERDNLLLEKKLGSIEALLGKIEFDTSGTILNPDEVLTRKK